MLFELRKMISMKMSFQSGNDFKLYSCLFLIFNLNQSFTPLCSQSANSGQRSVTKVNKIDETELKCSCFRAASRKDLELTEREEQQFVKADMRRKQSLSPRVKPASLLTEGCVVMTTVPSAEKQGHPEEGPHGRPCRHPRQQSDGDVLHHSVERVPLNDHLVGAWEKGAEDYFFIKLKKNN